MKLSLDRLRWLFSNRVVATEIGVSSTEYVRRGDFMRIITLDGKCELRRVRMIDGGRRRTYVY